MHRVSSIIPNGIEINPPINNTFSKCYYFLPLLKNLVCNYAISSLYLNYFQ